MNSNGIDIFEMYHLDLDLENPTIEGPILTYTFSYVRSFWKGRNDSQSLGFHCRGSSRKEKINLKEILITYMLHGTNLYMWADNGQQSEPELINQDQFGKP